MNETFWLNMKEQLGDSFPAFQKALEDAPALALRMNPLKRARLPEDFTDGRVPWEENGWYLRPDVRPGLTVAHAAGGFYLQEASAMVSVAALDPQPGERVLDLCAAPGGKSTQIAGRMRGKGLLIANEPEPSRAKILASSLERFGARNASVTNEYPPKLTRFGAMFDRVLVDAPCSGEGMFRREPASRDEWSPSSPEGCARRQADILDSAAQLVRPGGVMVYSTCTFNRTEDDDTVAAFLERHPDFALEPFELAPFGQTDGTLHVWPHEVRGDGHFCAKLRRTGEPPRVKPVNRKHEDFSRELAELSKICFIDLDGMTVERVGDTLCAFPEDVPDLRGLKVARFGLTLCRLGRSHLQPEHALAMALDPADAKNVLELDEAQARTYLSGETLPSPLSGWTLVTHEGLPLGWGKSVDGVLKNHLPKGLRQ